MTEQYSCHLKFYYFRHPVVVTLLSDAYDTRGCYHIIAVAPVFGSTILYNMNVLYRC